MSDLGLELDEDLQELMNRLAAAIQLTSILLLAKHDVLATVFKATIVEPDKVEWEILGYNDDDMNELETLLDKTEGTA